MKAKFKNMAPTSKLMRLKFLLLIAFYYTISDTFDSKAIGPISHIAQALLYHQVSLQPVLSRFNRQQANISSDYYLNSGSITSNNQQQQQQQQYKQALSPSRQQQLAQTSYLTSSSSIDNLASIETPTSEDAYGCPLECRCNKIAQIADCSARNLTRVPNGFPKDIKRIRLERNNITEIGPFAFQGLRRLQRIDLSNNNLQNIDSSAFSGGLQSLNSLILYSNKLEQLPVNVFSDLTQLQLLLLNANSLQSISKELFKSLANLNLLSLYDNNIVTLASGTFDGLKSIKTIHLGKNPLACDCNLRWLADYLELNPVETSEARCESPTRAQGKKLSLLNKAEFKCIVEPAFPSRITAPQAPVGSGVPSINQQQHQQQQQQPTLAVDQTSTSSCPAGCVCSGSTVDCAKASQSESKLGMYELPDVPDDIPVYVARVHINDSRIKRIRQTGLFRRLANSQKLDLGNNKIIDIEDNAINGQFGNSATNKAERVVFVLIENQFCGASAASSSPAATGSDEQQGQNNRQQQQQQDQLQQITETDPCSSAPRVNDPIFDSPCYNGGQCKPFDHHPGSGSNTDNNNNNNGPVARYSAALNYSCSCPVGFNGPLCEINIDDCLEHQCQNGAMCVDGINSYRCICRDPTTTGEYCEQLNTLSQAPSSPSSNGLFSFATSSANSINAPLALPIMASEPSSSSSSVSVSSMAPNNNQQQQQQPQPQQPISIRSVDFSPPSLAPSPAPPLSQSQLSLVSQRQQQQQQPQLRQDLGHINNNGAGSCRRLTQRKYVDDGNGCQSVRLLKLSSCQGTCSASDMMMLNQIQPDGTGNRQTFGCCLPAKVKHRRIRMQCSDGASYMRTIELIKKCACQSTSAYGMTNNNNNAQIASNQCPTTTPDNIMPLPPQPAPIQPVKSPQKTVNHHAQPAKTATNLAGSTWTSSSGARRSQAVDQYQQVFNLKQQKVTSATAKKQQQQQFNGAQDDQLMQITRLDAVD